MFSLKRKGDYRLQLTRTLKQPGRYSVEVYLFTPHETSLSAWTLAEQQFFFSSIKHRFSLLGLPDQDRISKADSSYALLSPHYEIMHGSRLFQYRASIDRLRQQLQGGDLSGEPIKRALRLSQNFAQRLRRSVPGQSNQQRYFRLADIYFSWYAEQFLLECMTLEGFSELDESIKDSIQNFLQHEYRHRRARNYLSDFHGSPTRIWNRMSLYQRLLRYPVSLRSLVTELGAGTRKMVKAISTMLIMSIFTYILFNTRETTEQLTFALLLGIALIYALRDLLRDDMIDGMTRWLRKGKPRWRVRWLTPYTNKLMAWQKVWLDYRKLPELPPTVTERAGNWATSEERQIICYRSVLHLDDAAVEQDQIQERITLDTKQLCELIETNQNKLYVQAEGDDPSAAVQVFSIEKQHDYNLLLVCTEPGQNHSSALRWNLRLGRNGIVHCDSKQANWPSPEEQGHPSWLQGVRERLLGD